MSRERLVEKIRLIIWHYHTHSHGITTREAAEKVLAIIEEEKG